MRTNRVFIDQPLAGTAKVSADGPVAHYLTRVLRLRVGNPLVVFDGCGGEYDATLAAATRDGVTLELGTHRDEDRESPLALTLGQGIARGERMDLVLQKATELGVSRIVPLLTEHTVVRLDAGRAVKRHQHWRRVIASACEQCGRNRLPNIAEPLDFGTWIEQRDESASNILLEPGAAQTLAGVAKEGRPVCLLIGPEGGLSPVERETAKNNGFEPASLGPRILRTETAAIAALAILQSGVGDL